MTRVWATIIGCASVLIAADLATAKDANPDKSAGGHSAEAHAKAHKHVHLNGHNLLGAKLKQDGKHEIGKVANRSVTAEVRGGKVVGMSAGDLAVKRVKTKTKMALAGEGIVRAAWSNDLQLAQYDPYYYGYCVDDGYDYTCYWYPESDVAYEDYSWDPYDPTY